MAEISFNPSRTSTPEKRIAYIRAVIARLNTLPGVISASIVNDLPLTGDKEIHSIKAEGKALSIDPANVSAEYRVIDAAYFRTMQIPLIAGRELSPSDPPAFAAINRTMAARLWPRETAVGKQFTDGDDDPPLTVVGVVGDVHNASLEKPAMMQFYRLITANPYADTFVIRTSGRPESLISEVQKCVWNLDSSEPVAHVQTLHELLDAVTLQRRFATDLIGCFAISPLFFSDWVCSALHRYRPPKKRASLASG